MCFSEKYVFFVEKKAFSEKSAFSEKKVIFLEKKVCFRIPGLPWLSGLSGHSGVLQPRTYRNYRRI